MGVTQRDLAEHLGVSVSTVSRALNNNANLRPETRSMVLDAAARLGYNSSTSYRVTGDNGRNRDNIGVLLRYDGSNAAPGHTRMLAGISDVCDSRGKMLNAHYAPGDQLEKLIGDDPPTVLQPDRVGGLILLNYFPDEIVEYLSKRWPTVVIHHYAPGLDVDIVEMDAIDGMGRLVKKLQDAGHERIGFIGDARGREWSHARHAAFVQALSSLDLEYDPGRFTEVRAGCCDRIGEWLENRMMDGTTAWICACDHLARSVGEHLLKRGYKVPNDVSITGFDGTKSLPNDRRITSIKTPFEALGAAATENLLRRLKYPQAARFHALISGQVVEGETVGEPALE